MKRVVLLAALVFVSAFIGGVSAQQDQGAPAGVQYAAGVVFHDANLNGVRDQGEKGLAGIRVSNSRISVKTDLEGKYKLPVSDDTIVFVIKPRNWMTAVDTNNVPRFYYIHKPNGSPKLKYKGVDPTGPLPVAIDFPLHPHPEPDRFRAVFMGDAHVDSIREIAYLAHDVIEELVGIDAEFAVTLGDIANSNLSVYEAAAPVIGRIGVPCYYVKGNHDGNLDGAPNQKHTDETFERAFGPSHYSFDYGPVHFIAIDNNYQDTEKSYHAALDIEQMAFIRDDLASIPKDQLVVLMMHIPIQRMKDRKQIFSLLESHPNTFSTSAHTHTLMHFFLAQADDWNAAKPHHHFVAGATCGTWWRGMPDETLIPHTTMRDGAPNGYSIITFDNNNYSIRYKAARRPADYQMTIYAPDIVEAAEAEKIEITVNVFAGSERSTVEMRLGETGAWIPLTRVEIEDPAFVQITALENSNPVRVTPQADDSKRELVIEIRRGNRDEWTPLTTVKVDDSTFTRIKAVQDTLNDDLTILPINKPYKSQHIWKGTLPQNSIPGTHMLYVRTTDMFGQTYTAHRIISIE